MSDIFLSVGAYITPQHNTMFHLDEKWRNKQQERHNDKGSNWYLNGVDEFLQEMDDIDANVELRHNVVNEDDNDENIIQ